MEHVSVGSFLIARLINIKARIHFEQNLKVLRLIVLPWFRQFKNQEFEIVTLAKTV